MARAAQPARCRRRRARGAPSAAEAEAAREPSAAPRRRVAGGVVWIGVVGVLLAGRRRAERRRAPAQHAARPDSSSERNAAPRRQRRSSHRRSRRRRRLGPHRRARERPARSRAGEPRRTRTHLDLRPMKLANRRIRLVLAVFALAFAGDVRARGVAPGRARGQLERLAPASTRRRSSSPPGAGTIFDRTGVQLAIGEQATTVYANPRQIRDPQRLRRSSRARARHRPETGASRSSPTGRTASSTSRARPTRRAPRS